MSKFRRRLMMALAIKYIEFVDALTESICATNWGDGTGITTSQAAAVTSVGTTFQGTAITSFDEFAYFTGVRTLSSGSATSGGAFYGCASLVKITLPSSITSFAGRYTFGGCTALEEIGINSSFTSNTYAFTGCTAVSKVHISDEATYLGCVFSSAQSWPLAVSTAASRGLYKDGILITHFIIPEGITTIRYRIFDNNNTLEELTIASTVTSTQSYAFNACSALARLNIFDLEKFLKISWNTTSGYPFYGNSAGGPLYLNGQLVTSIVVPSSVTSLKAYALFRVRQFTSITLHSGITSIGQNALTATNITSITIPSSVTTIGDSAFSYCRALQSIIIPETVTSCGDNLCGYCTSLVDFYDYRSGASTKDLVYVIGGHAGNGTGTMYFDKDCTLVLTTQCQFSFKKLIFNGSVVGSSGINVYSNDYGTCMEQIRIKGDFSSGVTGTNYYSLLQVNNNLVRKNSQLKFVEIMGTITVSRPFFVNRANDVADGCIYHFGYNGVTVTPALCVASGSRIAKVYVGTGESAADDQAVLDLYLADSNWSAYSSKLDTWYNYINDPDANPDFIN